MSNTAMMMGLGVSPPPAPKTKLLSKAAVGDDLTFIDISDPSSISVVSSIAHYDTVNQMGVSPDGNYAFTVGADYISSHTFTSAGLNTLQKLTSATLYDNAGDVIVDSNNVAYICSKTDYQIVAVDVSDPSAMTLLSTLADPGNSFGNAFGLALDEKRGHLWVTGYSSERLTCVDISNPSSMSVVGATSQTGMAGPWSVALDLKSKYAFVANAASGNIVSFNIASPETWGSTFPVNDSFNSSTMSDPYSLNIDVGRKLLFVTGNINRIAIIDISDPNNMSELGSFVGPDYTNQFSSVQISLYDPVTYMWYVPSNAGDMITAVDTTAPASMTVASSIGPDTTYLNGVRAITFA